MPLLLTCVGENMGHCGHAGPAGECRECCGAGNRLLYGWEKLPLFLLPTINIEGDGVQYC